jgi:hypothetical protein
VDDPIKVPPATFFLMISTALENAAAKNSVSLFTITTRPGGERQTTGSGT